MIWKDTTVIMAGSEFSPLGQRISAAGFGANPLEMRLPVTMFESLRQEAPMEGAERGI